MRIVKTRLRILRTYPDLPLMTDDAEKSTGLEMIKACPTKVPVNGQKQKGHF